MLGHWWTPGFGKYRVPGVLKFTYERGLELEMIHPEGGSFLFENIDETYELILGESNKRKQITLHNCVNVGKIQCQIGYLGTHFEKSEDLIFNKALVEFSYLDEWLKMPSFNSNFDFEGNYKLAYNRPLEIVANVEKERIAINHYLAASTNIWKNVHLNQVPQITIQLSKHIDLNDLLNEYIAPLGNLISLGTDSRSCLESIYVSKENDKGVVLKDIEVFFRTERANPKSVLQSSQTLFTLSEIDIGFNQAINNWLVLYGKAKEVFNLFFSLSNKDTVNIETDFLKLAQGVEAFHGKTFPEDKKFTKEFNDKKKRVKTTAENDLKQWVEDNIHNHGPVYQKRIEEVVEKTKNILNPLIQDYDIEDFIKKIKHSRNYYTHHTKSKHAVTTLKELIPLYNALLFMLKACFIIELGISEERCKALIESNGKYRYAVGKAIERYQDKTLKAEQELQKKQEEQKQELEKNKENASKNKASGSEVF